MIGSRLGPTLLLMGVSLLVSLILSVPAGIYSAVHQYTKRDYAVVTASFFGSSIPGFFLALVLVYIFTVRLGLLPSTGMETLGGSGGALDVAAHMVMPVLVLSVSMAGSNIRYIRSAVLEILEQDYLRTARAKGIGRRRVIWRHALANALVPIVTVIGMQIPLLFGGAVIVEQLFSWPAGPYDHERHFVPGLSGDYGGVPSVGGGGSGGESADRHPLRPGKSCHPV